MVHHPTNELSSGLPITACAGGNARRAICRGSEPNPALTDFRTEYCSLHRSVQDDKGAFLESLLRSPNNGCRDNHRGHYADSFA